jgi:hypothetical protein
MSAATAVSARPVHRQKAPSRTNQDFPERMRFDLLILT